MPRRMTVNAGFITMLLACMCSALPASAQDAEAARMLELPPPPPASTRMADHINSIKASYKSGYERAGRPRIAIFWNRKLDDQLSQWYTASRFVDTHDNGWQEGGFTASQSREDVEGRFSNRSQPSELAGFEFDAGLTRTLINAGTDVIDRGTIMRLEHGKAPQVAGGVVMTDYQEIEMEALVNYADLYAEILYADGPLGKNDFTVMISIREVRTGRTVAMLRSRPDVLPAAKTRTQWIPGERGYERFEVPVESAAVPALADGIRPGTAEYLGWLVALQTMEALSQFWSRTG